MNSKGDESGLSGNENNECDLFIIILTKFDYIH